MKTVKDEKPRMIEDAESFYTLIKGNPHYTGIEDKEAVDALDNAFGNVYRAANADGRGGIGRDRYLYFQGAVAGLCIADKTWRTTVESALRKKKQG